MTEQAHTLGDVLRAAREAKGVDLVRVERETKIRERYLSALERGDYRELPGAVYTKGFLRNYGAYLGLDPEDLIDLYRLETSVRPERLTVPAPPRPLRARRARAFVLTPGVIVAAVLTVLVGGFVAYLGYGLVTFARTPELRITDPAGNVNGHPELTITLRGMTAPNSRVTVGNLRENPTVTADDEGAFAVTVDLVPGSNVVELTAHDPVTGRDSQTETRTIIVASEPLPSVTPQPVALTLTAPATDATVDGQVEVAGMAQPGTPVTVTAALAEPPDPAFTITDAAGQVLSPPVAAPVAPEPVIVDADGRGTFTATIPLAPGRWTLTAATNDGEAQTRTVTVRQPGGLRAILRMDAGESYLDLDEDGAPAAASRSTATDGQRVELTAEETLRIRVGNAGAVQITINGVRFGLMGAAGEVVEWRVTAAE